MALLDRLIGTEEPKLPVHQFQAALDEWALGSSVLGNNNAQRRTAVINAFNISASEEADLDFIADKYVDAVTNGKSVEFSKILDNVLLLAEQEMFYGLKADIVTRLNEASGP